MIGLLNAYEFETDPESYQRAYAPMFLESLHRDHPGETVKVYRVGLGEFPKSVSECDSWIIGGSAKSAYDSDPWISQLGKFVQAIDRAERKLVGVCFGHQLIAHYLGGRTEKSKKGWGVGVRDFEVMNRPAWLRPELQTCSLIYSHQDQVALLPKNAELLGRSDFCANEMYSIGNHILCLQGHPEFTAKFAKARLDTRINLIGQETYDRAVASLARPTNADQVGAWMREFFNS